MESILYGVETEFGFLEFFEFEDDALGYASMMNDDHEHHEHPVRKFLLKEIVEEG